ncbi:MAG TPA: HNH endonuclease signature motif containing protein [Phycisphaerae bacterium]|nr:HNH endonuclease signature motif containing protein [Phycisphaerae bacterium]
MSLSAIPSALRKQIFTRDAARCRYCGLLQIGQAAVFHINHILPRSAGGLTIADNLVLQCPSCSLHKSNKTTALDPETRLWAALFHPLEQNWNQHFSLDEHGAVRGLTPAGRATSVALHMNDPLPLIARALQLRLGLISP